MREVYEGVRCDDDSDGIGRGYSDCLSLSLSLTHSLTLSLGNETSRGLLLSVRHGCDGVARKEARIRQTQTMHGNGTGQRLKVSDSKSDRC